MKNLLLSAAFGLLSVGAFAQTTVTPVSGSGPMISLDKDLHDYGNLKQGGNGTCEFVVTNTGDQPLIITNCQGSCGCTVPKCEKEPIKPGQTSTISVKFDTNRVGAFNKSVTISSNAVNTPSKIVTVKGVVEGSAAATTPTSPVKEVSPMAPVEKM